ncbi:triacylglycerol lipase [Ferrimonas sp. SCSIO 43195]|uniref:lipase family alpha/beta hydrolase n=1 Tax=Ferrimonas sp. SCSIO 43195 TaxID=2822844 RepID=UPI0020758583|nr:triacylglycerol lipase [Ferrimonas sp. SCSIO 43195]USD39611.1 triacylglycerol lipase [Ferrimonas sp. SCSIO 43195]
MVNLPRFLTLIVAFSLSFPALSGDRSNTRYPIMMVHGIFGFDSLLGVDYFYGVPEFLSEDGATVFLTAVSAANATEVRGEQLIAEVEAVLALTGADKVNLIGHSHGGPTVRYVASVAPHLVASVTSVGGVNWGSPVADALRDAIEPGSVTESVAAAAANALANLIELLSGSSHRPTDALAATESLTTAGTLAFNQRYPEGVPQHYCGDGEPVAANGVHYFSWSGDVSYTNVFDPVDPFLAVTSLIIDDANDGLVSACSSHLGLVLNDSYRMNHLDEINQSFGLTHFWETDPKRVYRDHARRLKSLGL